MTRLLSRLVLAAALTAGFAAAPALAFQFQDTEGNAMSPSQNFYDVPSTAPTGPDHKSFFGDRKTRLDTGTFSMQVSPGPGGNYRNLGQDFRFNSQFDRYDPFGAQNR